jgi:hypothetical protein
MTVLHSEPAALPVAEEPRFDLAIQPWALVAIASAMALLLLAFYIYGQVAPGA